MPAKNVNHAEVVAALVADGWTLKVLVFDASARRIVKWID